MQNMVLESARQEGKVGPLQRGPRTPHGLPGRLTPASGEYALSAACGDG